MRRSSRLWARAAVPALALVLAAPSARADKPDPALAFLAGTCAFLAGFAAGGVLLGTSQDSEAQTRAGWMTIEAGFALAPVAAHAVTGEWTRAVAFAATPTAALAVTATVVGIDPSAIDRGQVAARVSVWSLFSVGLVSGAIGVVDSAFASTRTRTFSIAPIAGPGQVGLSIGATL